MEDKPDFEKLYDIFKDYPGKLEAVKNWEKNYRLAALKNNLYEHEAIKQLIELITGYIAENENKLKNQKRSDYANDNIYFDERTRCEAENNCWRLLISFFTNTQSTLSEIENKVEETKHINSNA